MADNATVISYANIDTPSVTENGVSVPNHNELVAELSPVAFTGEYSDLKNKPISATGPTGPQGSIGPTGPQGNTGPAGNGFNSGVKTVTSSYQVLTTDNIIFADGTFNITLPNPALMVTGIPIYIKNVGLGVITILPFGNELVEGVNGITISLQHGSATLVTDGINWYLI